MKIFMLFIAVSVLLVSVASAETQLDLPELSGDYSIGGEAPSEAPSARTTTFAFPDSVESIAGLRLVISGTWTSGLVEWCRTEGEITVCDTLPAYTDLTLRLTADSLVDCSFEASLSTSSGVNQSLELIDVCDEGQADVTSLLGTAVTAELFCDLPEETIANMIEATHGTLADVHLETVGVLPVTAPSWGSVKAQYR